MLSRTSGIFLLIFTITIFSFAQSKKDETVIAKYGDHTITAGEFNQAYAKNGVGSGDIKKDSLSSLKNFLGLYLVYKMKLADGYSQGLDKDPDIIKEVKEYSDQVANTVYIEKTIIEPNLKRLYERGKWEYRVSHIMFTPAKGNENETLKLANAILDSVRNGADFSEMAKKYSEDKFSKENGGDLYYITTGQLPLSIENAIYSTKEGQVYPKLVRSDFGYHIIKVTEKRERHPKIRVSHILIKPVIEEKQSTPVEMETATEKAKQLADSVYQKLKAGGDFAELAEKYSDDPGSAIKGGDIGFFSRNQTVRPFDEAAFNLKKEGDISEVIQSPFGFHIIKLTGILAYPSYDEEKDELLKVFKARQYNEVYNNILDSLRTKYNYTENKEVLNIIKSRIDSLKNRMNFAALPDSIKDKILFTEDNKNYTVGNFVSILEALPKEESEKLTKMPFQESVLKVAGEQLLLKNLPDFKKTDPAIKNMLEDYKKGAIIFKLQQEEIWNKLKMDSASVFNYFITHDKKYMWPDRVKFTELFTLSDSLIHHYENLIRNGADFDTLCANYTERKGYKEKVGHWTLRDKTHNDLYEKAWSMTRIGQFSDIYKNFGGYSIVRLDQKDPAHIKTFDEARTQVTSDYQEEQMEELEKAYQEKLSKKYKPIIYTDHFEEIYKNNN